MTEENNIKKFNDEVFVAAGPVVKVDRNVTEFLKSKSASNIRNRARLSAHGDIKDKLHEMFIVLTGKGYIRPHKHSGKSESFHIIEGLLDVVIFDEDGKVVEVIQMGDYASGKIFYYRIPDAIYHAPFVKSDSALFHEVTNGPFSRPDTIFAPWAPEENNSSAVDNYIVKTAKEVDAFLRQHK